MRKGYIILFITCWLLPLYAGAQVVFNFLPEVHGRTPEGLFMVKLGSYQGQKQLVSLQITVTEEKSGKIMEIFTPPFELYTGMNALPSGLARGAAVNFAGNRMATVSRQSNYFPEGDYEYCFRLMEGNKGTAAGIIAEQCFNYYLQPFSPLLLIEPYEGDVTCNKRPTFFWQPMLPAIPGVLYRLILTEIKEGQHKAEALNYNLPLVNQTGIPAPMLFYPPTARELQEGKHYAWQVTAYKNDLVLANSEIWDFHIACTDSTENEPLESYRNIEDLAKGNFYVAKGRLLFAVNNTYEQTTLQYSIRCLSKPDLKINKLPLIKLSRGTNQVTIDLAGNSRYFTDGYFYVMQVKLPNGEEKQLRFIYKQAD